MGKHKTDDRWTTHLHYHWWKYVLLISISVMLWSWVFDTLAKPAKSEKIGIVFFGEGLDTQALHADLWAAMDDLTQQEIRFVDVSQTFADRDHLGQILMARTYDSDLLILPAELVDNLSAYGFFMPLENVPKGIATYSQKKGGESVVYGLEIYSSGNQNRFSAFCSDEQTYYVFLSKESVNLAGLNGNGSQTDDAALQILTYLLEEPYGTNGEKQKSSEGL